MTVSEAADDALEEGGAVTILRMTPRSDGTCPAPVCTGTLPPINWNSHVRWHQIMADLRSARYTLSVLTRAVMGPEAPPAVYCPQCFRMAVRPQQHEHIS